MPQLFAYIWRHSRRQQLVMLAVVLASLPFYFLSLDLPRTIVNDAIQGRAFRDGRTEATLFAFRLHVPGRDIAFPGIGLARLDYLLVLSGIFMVLVLVNGAFRYVVNMQKGRLGEGLLRRLRLDLFTLILRSSPTALRVVKPAEVATIIRDEVEPIGGFVGDAFIQPAFLGGQALTALAFILVQSPLLGGLAGLIVLMQAVVIPRMRREQLRLGRQRQVRSRSLAGHVGEIVEAMGEVAGQGTAPYERRQVGVILDELFWIRYDLYARKFMVKFVNSILAQLTPFLFYSIGGYFALRGSLDIGQLVAVIAAYRDLPPPIKELIDWDQQRLDVEVKYQQILEQFALPETPAGAEAPAVPLDGTIELEALRVLSPTGEVVLDGTSLSLPLGGCIVVSASRGEGFAALAGVLARRITDYGGSARLAGREIGRLPAAWTGANLAYVGPDSIVFDRSLHYNLTYGLRGMVGPGMASPGGDGPDWSDPPVRARDAAPSEEAPPALDAAERDMVDILREVDPADSVYRLGLARRPPRDGTAIAGPVVALRRALRARLAAEGLSELVESFEAERFNSHATLGENLFFGAARPGAALEVLFRDEAVQAAMAGLAVEDGLLAVGRQVTASLVEMFSEVAADYALLERFSLIPVGELPAYRDLHGRARGAEVRSLAEPDRLALLRVALGYVETRHRLGLVTGDLEARIVAARRRLLAAPGQALPAAIEVYDPGRLCSVASMRDNLLFGRVRAMSAGAEERVEEVLRAAVREAGLDEAIHRLGLEHEAGPGGRLVPGGLRAALVLARSLLKRPALLVLDQPEVLFADADRTAILAAVRRRMAGRTLVVATRDARLAEAADLGLVLAGARVQATRPGPDGRMAAGGLAAGGLAAGGLAVGGLAAQEGTEPMADGGERGVETELQALRGVPMFAALSTPRLRLIAFTSTRLRFRPGQVLLRQGEAATDAFIVLSGEIDIHREAGGVDGGLVRHRLATLGRHAVLGEMGLIGDAPRSATAVAVSDVEALRIERAVFLDLVREIPALALSIMRSQIDRLNRAEAELLGPSAGLEPAGPAPAAEAPGHARHPA